MKRTVCLLLSLLLLLSGCTIRRGPQPAPGRSGPISVQDDPEPTLEPTPCPHDRFSLGVCTDCGYACPHAEWEEGRCVLCGEFCTHRWEEGVCAVCGEVCPHGRHDADSCLCTECGVFVRHHYFNSVCSLCGGEPEFSDRDIPEELRVPCEQKGTLEHVTYRTHNYPAEAWGVMDEYDKSMTVYLPYGYDPAKQYDVIVIMHGMGYMSEYWMDTEQEYSHEGERINTVDVLDNMIARGLCPPVIVAAPTFYRDSVVLGEYLSGSAFAPELRNDVIPYLVEHYATYAAEPTSEAVAAAREHFAYVGLSMGSIIGFQSALTLCLDLFGYYGCFSGFSTYPANILSVIDTEEFADYPIYYLYNNAGAWDIALNDHRYFYNDLIARSDRFVEGENTCFVQVKDYGHEFRTWIVGLYDCLGVFFAFTP